MKEVQIKSLKKKVLFGGWISIAINAWRHDKIKGKKMPNPFDGWMYRESGIKKQKIYYYRNFYKLMSVTRKLLNC